MRKDLISIVTATYKEGANLPLIYEGLVRLFAKLGKDWEWIVVDDHSPDQTFRILSQIAADDSRLRVYRLAHRTGSDAALSCGLERARGVATVIFPADLVHPPETITSLVAEWRNGAKVVWAMSYRRFAWGDHVSFVTRAFSRIPGLEHLAQPISSFYLIDAQVLASLSEHPEKTGSIALLVAWMGFREARVDCERHSVRGPSREALGKRMRRLEDAVVSFSDFPFRAMAMVGFGMLAFGLFFAGVVLHQIYTQRPVQSVAAILATVFFVGGTQLWMMGIVGRYLWQALQESRKRPRYVVEETLDLADTVPNPKVVSGRR